MLLLASSQQLNGKQFPVETIDQEEILMYLITDVTALWAHNKCLKPVHELHKQIANLNSRLVNAHGLMPTGPNPTPSKWPYRIDGHSYTKETYNLLNNIKKLNYNYVFVPCAREAVSELWGHYGKGFAIEGDTFNGETDEPVFTGAWITLPNHHYAVAKVTVNHSVYFRGGNEYELRLGDEKTYALVGPRIGTHRSGAGATVYTKNIQTCLRNFKKLCKPVSKTEHSTIAVEEAHAAAASIDTFNKRWKLESDTRSAWGAVTSVPEVKTLLTELLESGYLDRYFTVKERVTAYMQAETALENDKHMEQTYRRVMVVNVLDEWVIKDYLPSKVQVFSNLTDAPEDLQERIALLQMIEVGDAVEGVGARIESGYMVLLDSSKDSERGIHGSDT
jgi:hypothetical protein